MISPEEALTRLREGNLRFASGSGGCDSLTSPKRRSELTSGQQPFAIILGCSDSRAPVELVFDQGLGDLFVIRVAGNIVAPSQIGSVEFAAEKFGARLVVVLGHTDCGAVSTAIEQIMRPTENQSPNLRSIVDRVRPAIEPLLQTELNRDQQKLALQAVRANVAIAVDHLMHGSETLERLIEKGRLSVVGAQYCLETGRVDFFDKSSGQCVPRS